MAKRNLLHCCWERTLVQPLWEAVWRFLKLNIELPSGPVVLLLSICRKKTKTLIGKDLCSPAFPAAQIGKKPKCPRSSEWIDKLWLTYDGILDVKMRSCHLQHVHLESIILGKSEKYHMVSLMGSIRNKKTQQKPPRLSILENTLMVTRGDMGGGG